MTLDLTVDLFFLAGLSFYLSVCQCFAISLSVCLTIIWFVHEFEEPQRILRASSGSRGNLKVVGGRDLS